MLRPAFLLLLSLAILTVVNMGCDGPIHYPDGGYGYPNKIEDSNNYFYPLRDSLRIAKHFNSLDSFLIPFFDELNLSLRPKGEDVFRLTIVGFKQLSTVITLTKNQIVSKTSPDEFFVPDISLLSKEDRVFFNASKGYFYNRGLAHIVDSLRRIYPRMRNPNYVRRLSDSITIRNQQFKYTTTVKQISYRQFYDMVSAINKSGYWSLPLKENCEPKSHDGEQYILEANTAKKYNCLFSNDCDDRDAFVRACLQLVSLAEVDRRRCSFNTHKPLKPNP